MAFSEAHPKRVRAAFIRATLDEGMSVAAAVKLAKAGGLPGVKVSEIPPQGTVASWRTDEARERETAQMAGTDEGAGTIVDEALSLAAMTLREDARRLARKRPRATPAEWAELAKAAGAVGKARREANGPPPKRTTPVSAAPAQDDTPAETWVDSIDPDA
jgi:hypothetical protein